MTGDGNRQRGSPWRCPDDGWPAPALRSDCRCSDGGGEPGARLAEFPGNARCQRPLRDQTKGEFMLKFLGSAVGIIFLVGLLVIIGILSLIF